MRLFPVSLGLCLLAASAFAQTEVGGATLNGTILDPAGAAVSGAKVTLQNKATGLLREQSANEAGLFNFTRVPVGRYDISVEMQGFKKARRDNIELSVGAVLSLNLNLEIGAATESITITGEVPLVESTRSQTVTTVNSAAVRDLPINGRNFTDFTLLTPGVVRDPTRGGDLSFGGQRGTANSVLVDGGDTNNLFFGQSSGRAGAGRNPYTFSQDSVAEFQVNTNTFAAEIGRAGGGVVNVITKSGTNDLHGSAFWFYRNRPLNANNFINKSRGIDRTPYAFQQFGGNLAGPIKKDKLFYFFNYDGQRNNILTPVFFPIAPATDPLSQQAVRELTPKQVPYTVGQDNNIYTGKIDWNINAGQTLSVRYNAHRFTGKNFENSGNQSSPERTGNSNISTDNLAVNYTRLFGTSVVWDSRFIYLRDDEPGLANSDQPEAQIRQAGTLMIAIGRNNFSPRYTNTDRYQTVQALTINSGRHSMKFGMDMNIERVDNFFPGNFSGSYTFDTLADFAIRRASAYTQAFAGAGTTGPLTQPHINEFAWFAQDSWRVSERLTLNYGFRYDVFQYKAGSVLNPDPGLIAQNLNTNRINFDSNNLAGRFGFAYKLDRAGRTVMRGGIGNYYARTPAIMTGTSHSQNGIQVATYTLRATVPAQASQIPTYPAILSAPPTVSRIPDIYVFDPRFTNPNSFQWSYNLERQLGRDYAVTVGYLGVRGLHLGRTRDSNLFPAQPIAATYSDGRPVTYFGRLSGARPNPNFGRVSLFESGASSTYHGGFIQLTKRFSQSFQLLTSYTWSKVIDTFPEATSVVVGTGDDAKVAADTLNPNNDRGLGDTDVRHRFILSGIWEMNYYRGSSSFARGLLNGYQLSAIGNIQSGRPFSQTVNVDLNNDGNVRNDRQPGIGRNTIAGPGFNSWDVRVSKDVPLWKERITGRIMVEAFNVLNNSNVRTIQTTPYNFNATTRVFTPVTTYLNHTAAFDPRIIQLAARILW